MGKFNISTTQSGELTDVAELAHTDLPVETEVNEEASQSPQEEGSAIDQLLSEQVGAGIEAGIQREQEIADQREREAVPDIITRRDDESRVDVYNFKGIDAEKSVDNANSGPNTDGGLADRSRNMAKLLILLKKHSKL